MIYIIGAGAIGQALAAMLQNSGREVLLVKSRPVENEQSSLHIKVMMPNGELQALVPVAQLGKVRFKDGPILVTVKSFANDAIAQALQQTDQPVVLLQNGLNIEQTYLNRGIKQLYRCVLLATSQFDPDGSIRFRPVNASPIGCIQGQSESLGGLLSQLENPWFPFKGEDDIRPLIWKKVIANCVFNSICPLLDADNGVFHRNTNALAMARQVIGECLAVALKQGVRLTAEEVERNLLAISRMSEGQFISTLQDIRNKRPTEIATLNAEIVRLAGDLPVTYTRLLGELTTLKSQLNLL